MKLNLYPIAAILICGCATDSTTISSSGSASNPTLLPPTPPTRSSAQVKRALSQPRKTAIIAAVRMMPASAPTSAPVQLAPHGDPRFQTNYIPYEVIFLALDYHLTGETTYQFEVAENPAYWIPTIDPYFSPYDDVVTKTISFSVNGTVVPRQFMRMRVLP